MASLRTGYIQRKCACGGESASGQCPECRKRATGRTHLLDSPSLARRAPASQGLAAEAAEPRPGHSFSDVRMYADAEISAIESSADESGETAPGQTGSAPCTSAEVDQTKKAAEAGRIAGRISVANAVRALGTVATPELQCAFASNFNTPATDPAFQTRRLIVQRFLTALAGRMGTAEPYICQPGNDPVCAQHGKTADVVAYVRGNKPPINFCPVFRTAYLDDPEPIIIHEYLHLVGNIDDSGGYAFGGNLGADSSVMNCQTGVKFKAAGDVLIHTADALAGFVLNMRTSGSQAPSAGQPGSGTPGAGQPPPNVSPP
jgi:hypothetical protein